MVFLFGFLGDLVEKVNLKKTQTKINKQCMESRTPPNLLGESTRDRLQDIDVVQATLSMACFACGLMVIEPLGPSLTDVPTIRLGFLRPPKAQ